MNNKLLSKAFKVLLVGSLISVFWGCQTFISLRSDDYKARSGISEWNDGDLEMAIEYWSMINDRDLRTKYVEAYETRLNVVREIDSFERAESNFAFLVEELERFRSTSVMVTLIPNELKIPVVEAELDVISNSLQATSIATIQRLYTDGRLTDAYQLANAVVETFGRIPIAVEVISEVDGRQERLAERFDGLRLDWQNYEPDRRDFEDSLANLGRMETDANWIVQTVRSGDLDLNDTDLEIYLTTSERIRSEISIERTRLVRTEFNQYSETIGRLFAEAPRTVSLDSVSLEDIDDIFMGTLEDMNRLTDAMIGIARRYPNLVDSGALRRVENERNAYENRIQDIRRQISVREAYGKPVYPPIIGLFNPEPGYFENSARSRPGTMNGRTQRNNPDWWWGAIESRNRDFVDLVIESRSDVAIDVYGESHKRNDRTRPSQDLVSQDYAGGGYWPVLNASNRLEDGEYAVRIAPAGSPARYEANAVVYRAFISVYF